MLLNYSPSSCDPELLTRCTVADSRLRLIETLIEAVRHEVGRKSHQHQILIGPRGSGKTHILTLLVHRLHKERDLREKVLPVQLPEELTAAHSSDLLNQIIEALADRLDHDPCGLETQAAAISRLCRYRKERIQQESDDREALNLAFESLDEISQSSGRLLIAVVENFDSLLYSGPARSRTTRENPQWAFRKGLMACRGMLLIAAAPSLFGEVKDPGAPFHDFFREHDLKELSLNEMMEMIRVRLEVETSGVCKDEHVRRRLCSLKADLPRREPTLRGVLTLAGGLPRFGHLLFDLLTETEIGTVVGMLSKFLDTQTPYFQARLNPRLVPDSELEILDCIASAEGPLTPKQISRELRGVPANAAATLLKRLLERGLLRKTGESRKEVRYDVAEPLFRVWRRFRTGRGERERLLLLAEFIAALYEPAELMAERALLAQSDASALRLQLLEMAIERQHTTGQEQVGIQVREFSGEKTTFTKEWDIAEEECMRGNLQAAFTRMTKVITTAKTSGDKSAYARALGRYSHMALLAGDMSTAFKAAEEGERIAEQAGSDLGRANCILSRGYVLFRRGQNKEAIEAFDAAEELYMKIGSNRGRSQCNQRRGEVLFFLGRNEEASKAFDAAEQLYLKIGDDLGHADCNQRRGEVLFFLGRNEEASKAFDAAEQLFMKVGNELGRANCIHSRGRLLFFQDRNDEASKAFDAAEELYMKVGSDRGRANCILSRGDVLFRLGQNKEAREAYDAAEQLFMKVGDDLGRASCILHRGGILFRLGHSEKDSEAFDIAEQLFMKVGDDLGRANCIRHRGAILFSLGRNKEAREAFDAAEQLFMKVGDDLGRANCMSSRGVLLAHNGQWQEGLEQVLAALKLAQKMGNRRNIELIVIIYFRILEKNIPNDSFRQVADLLRKIPNLTGELESSEEIRRAYSRLGAAVIRKAQVADCVDLAHSLSALLPDRLKDLFRPVLLAADVRSGRLNPDLPSEPEEVRRVVREILTVKDVNDQSS